MGKDRSISIEFSEDEISKWEKKMQGQQEENELIEKLANLTKNEMMADRTLTLDGAVIRVINKTPEIQRMMKGVETRIIGQTVKKMDAGTILTHLVNKKIQGDNNISFREAFTEVQTENPELAMVYVNDIRTL